MRHHLMPVLLFVVTIAFATSPFFVPEFRGFDPDLYPVSQENPPVQPAGYAFAIWGLIYAWLIVSAGFGLFMRVNAPDWTEMRKPLILSLAIGATWLPVAVLSPIWATVLIWAMLGTALVALWRTPVLDAWAAAWPVGLYAGWLSAASCVALGLLLAGYGVIGERPAAFAMITLAALLACTLQWRLERAPTYGAAVIWALVAVMLRNGIDDPVGVYAVCAAVLVLWPTLRAARF